MVELSIREKNDMKNLKELKIPVICGTVLGVKVYRGYARLCDLSEISKADIYDQKDNPKGTQRDLSPKHAREAYEYVGSQTLAFWPEVFLCVRNKSIISFSAIQNNCGYGILAINIEKIRNMKNISISRVDGNHRLH